MGAADLARKKCKPCEGGVAPLNDSEAAMLLGQIKGWQLNGAVISKTYEFANYYQTMAFVNAVAWLAHRASVRLFSCPLHTETPETEVPHAFAQSSFQAR